MTTWRLPMRLERAETPQRPTAASLVAGSSARAWLRESTRWDTPQCSIKFLPVKSLDSAEAESALIVPSTVPKSGVSSLCRPYGCIARRLYVPVDAVVVPHVADSEWDALLPDAEAVFIWQPDGRFTRIDPHERLTLTQLISKPMEQVARWDAARQATVHPGRLLNVTSNEPPPSLAEALSLWQGEVGEVRPLKELPPAPGEPPITVGERLRDASKSWRTWASRYVSWSVIRWMLPFLAALLLAPLLMATLKVIDPDRHKAFLIAMGIVCVFAPILLAVWLLISMFWKNQRETWGSRTGRTWETPGRTTWLGTLIGVAVAARLFAEAARAYQRDGLQGMLIGLAIMSGVIGLIYVAFLGLERLGGPTTTTVSAGASTDVGRHVPAGMFTRFMGRMLGGAVAVAGAVAAAGAAIMSVPRGLGLGKAGRASIDQAKRHREVARLLHMLDVDPLQGLRYAIPMGGDPGRGVGFGGNELVAGGTFEFGGSRSGPVDVWNIDPNHQLELNRKYRGLAEGELARGNHRRAAWIYSQLLGDWNSAANALAAGHRYIEAAAIYRDRLRNIPEAARCYEKGRQYDLALSLYTEREMWVPAGDLLMRIDRHEEGHAAYLKAVELERRSGNVTAAARLLETKLDDVDGALDLLDRSSSLSSSTAAPLREAWFDMAGRHQRHELVQHKVRTLSSAACVVPKAIAALPMLQRIRQSYVDAPTAKLAEAEIWRLVGRHLEAADAFQTDVLTSYLPPLAASDRLLRRDGQRFTQQRRSKAPAPRGDRRSAGRLQLRPMRQFHLERPLEVGDATPTSLGWIVLTGRDLLFAGWSGETTSTMLRILSSTSATRANRTFVLGLGASREVWTSRGIFSDQTLRWPDQPAAWTITRPSCLPEDSVLATGEPSGRIRSIWIDSLGAAWQSVYEPRGQLVRSFRLLEGGEFGAVDASAPDRFQMKRRADSRMQYVCPLIDETCVVECRDAAGALQWAYRFPGGRIVLAAADDEEGVLLLARNHAVLFPHPEGAESSWTTIPDWDEPCGAFLAERLVAIADDERLAVYQLDSGELVAEVRRTGSRPIAVAEAGTIGRISVVCDDGQIELFELCWAD